MTVVFKIRDGHGFKLFTKNSSPGYNFKLSVLGCSQIKELIQSQKKKLKLYDNFFKIMNI